MKRTFLYVVLSAVVLVWTSVAHVPVASNKPEPVGSVKLNGTLVAGGDVQDFAISPDGDWVIYVADQDTDEMFELYRVDAEGGTPVKLSGPLPADGDVNDFVISPDGDHVVYRADALTDGKFHVFSVPVSGGDPVQLSDRGSFTYRELLISPNSGWVAYVAPDSLFGNPVFFTVPIAGGTIYEHNTELPVGSGGVTWGEFSPNSQWLLFIHRDSSPEGPSTLYSTPPGQSGKTILGTYIYCEAGRPYPQISPDSARAAYCVGSYEMSTLYSRRIDGTEPAVMLSDPEAYPFSSVNFFTIGPSMFNSTFLVVFNDSYHEGLQSIGIDGSERFLLGDYSDSFTVSYDGIVVVYENVSLFSIDILGFYDPIDLGAPIVTGGSVDDFLISPDDDSVIFRADKTTYDMEELYAVPILNYNSVKLNPPLTPNGDVEDDYKVSSDSAWVVFRADHQQDGIFELFTVLMEDCEPRILNGDLPPAGSIAAFDLTPDGTRAVYLGDQDHAGTMELYVVRLEEEEEHPGNKPGSK